MFPTTASTLFVVLFFLPGFVRLEPAETTEKVSVLMVAAVSAPVLIFVWGGIKGLLSWLATERLVRRWVSRGERRSIPGSPAYRINSDFPVVCLAGVLRPRLFISSKVLSSCTPEEIAAVLAHETAHRRRGDNLKRLLMRFCPDFLAWTRTAQSMERTWSATSDLAADESATGNDVDARADLAAALVKVARLAAGRRFLPDILASAFQRGECIDRRVRRLLDEPVGAPARRYISAWTVLGTVVLSLACEPKVLEHVHRATETIFHLLQ
jgi:Zn-dependent protease with chaperone function